MFYRISIQSSMFYPIWVSINSFSIYAEIIIATHLLTTGYLGIGLVLLVAIQTTLQSVVLDRYMTWRQKTIWVVTEAISLTALLCGTGLIGFMLAFDSGSSIQSQESTLATVKIALQIAFVSGAISLSSAYFQSLSKIFRRRKLWLLWSTICWLVTFVSKMLHYPNNNSVVDLLIPIFILGTLRSLLIGIGFQVCELQEIEP